MQYLHVNTASLQLERFQVTLINEYVFVLFKWLCTSTSVVNNSIYIEGLHIIIQKILYTMIHFYPICIYVCMSYFVFTLTLTLPT
jgi:hypothetical protein